MAKTQKAENNLIQSWKRSRRQLCSWVGLGTRQDQEHQAPSRPNPAADKKAVGQELRWIRSKSVC